MYWIVPFVFIDSYFVPLESGLHYRIIFLYHKVFSYIYVQYSMHQCTVKVK